MTFSRCIKALLPGTVAALALIAAAPAAQAQVVFTTDRGWYEPDGFHDPDNDNYFSGFLSIDGFETRNWFVFDIPALAAGQEYKVAAFTFNVFEVESPQGSETLVLNDYTGSISALTDGTGGTAAFSDMGGGVTYGTITITTAQDNQFATVTFTSQGLAAVNAAAGGQFAFGGFLSTLSGNGDDEFIGALSRTDNPADGNTFLTLRSGPTGVAVIPEPSEWATGGLIVATLGMGMVRARRRKAASKA